MTTLLVSARAIHYLSGMVLAGVVMFRGLIVRPGMTGLFFASFFRRLKSLFVWAAAGVLVSEIALFWITGSEMADEPLTGSDAVTVLFQTQFGQVCFLRAGLIVLLAVLMVPLLRRKWTGLPSRIEIGAGIPALLLLASNSLAGHAAALGIFSWRVVPDILHLLTVSVWPIGLLFFALFLSAAKERPVTAEIQGVVGRFSNVSFAAVMILLLTGALNARCLVGSFSAFVTTPYGHVLDLKLFLFGAIVFIAAWNRYRIVPAFFRAQPADPRFLRGFVLIELALALLIVFVVSILGITPPPK